MQTIRLILLAILICLLWPKNITPEMQESMDRWREIERSKIPIQSAIYAYPEPEILEGEREVNEFVRAYQYLDTKSKQ
jgi:hypothetical protein